MTNPRTQISGQSPLTGEVILQTKRIYFRLIILFIAFLFLILSLIGAISITACVLSMEDEMEADCQSLQYLILLTRINTSSLPGLTREERLRVEQLREEVERSEALYRERHQHIYDLDHDSDEDIYHLHYNSQEEEQEEQEELVRLSEVVGVRWEAML